MPPDRSRRSRAGEGTEPRPGEVYFEFQQVGSAIRVAAVDAATGVEVAIMGPVSATQGELERVAMAKLQRRLAREAGG